LNSETHYDYEYCLHPEVVFFIGRRPAILFLQKYRLEDLEKAEKQDVKPKISNIEEERQKAKET
jgi:hypothetical protein